MNVNTTDAAAMAHFIDLAREGKRPACSSGEHAARELAKAVLKYGPVLDDLAIDGLCRFVVCASTSPTSCRDLLDRT